MEQPSTHTQKSTPNCLLITVDALRTDALGCYGNPRANTPHLDRLSAEGLRFTQAFSAGSWTQAAFPALLTSTYPAMYGGCLGKLSPQRPSPVESIAAAGYATAGFATNPHVSAATGYDRGFQTFVDFTPPGKDPFLREVKGGQRLLRQPLTHKIARRIGLNWSPRRVYSPAEEVTTRLRDWIGAQTQPFFAWAHFMDVHWPYYHQQGNQTAADQARAWQDLAWMHRYSHGQGDHLPSHLAERFQHLYFESLAYLDKQIGELLNWLDTRGLSQDTLVILTADHGEEFGDHGRWGHWESNLHDEILRVPLILRWPAEVAAGENNQLVRTIDLMPTILDSCQLDSLESLNGHTLRPTWQSSDTTIAAEAAIAEMPRLDWQRYAVRTVTHKLIWDSRHPDRPELYDLQNDPTERENQAETQPETLQALQDILDEHLAMVAAHQASQPTDALELDEELIRRLQDLGYLA